MKKLLISLVRFLESICAEKGDFISDINKLHDEEPKF